MYTEQTYLALCIAIAAMPFVHKITGAVEYESLATAAGPIWRQLGRGRTIARVYSQEGFLRHSEECEDQKLVN
jgi:hypothetical protein